jgi:translation initiation factor IF-2
MTDDRDFKQLVRERAAKTGESYQAARRQLERISGQFSARAVTVHETPSGLALGCIMMGGRVARGMTVTVTADDGTKLRGIVKSLRHMKDDVDSFAFGEVGEFGLILEPTYSGPIPAQVTG